MSRNLWEQFPDIRTRDIIIRKMTEADIDAFMEICGSENVYRYTPDFMFTKNRKTAANNISQLGGRDFEKKRYIIAGVFLPDQPDKVIGTAEIFGYDKTVNMVEIGYRINESYWHRGVATKVIHALVTYLFDGIGINRIQATVMPENTYSAKALLKNGFQREGLIRQGSFWKGQGLVDLEMYSLLKEECSSEKA